MDEATRNESWLHKVLDLRNKGLHGRYLPENIRIYVGAAQGVDMRLVGHESGIVADIPLPDDFGLICDMMESLIRDSRNALTTARAEKAARRDDESAISAGFGGLDSGTA